MRLLYVWVTAVISCAIVTIFWLVGNAIVLAIVNGALGNVTGRGFSLTLLIEYIAAWWGPLFDVAIIFWAIMASEWEEIYSVVNG